METKKMRSISPDNYVGKKTQILSARIEQMKYGAVVKIVSHPLEFVGDDSLPEGKELHASTIFSLPKDEETGKFIIAMNSKLDKFLQKKGVKVKDDYDLGDNIKELVGVDCVVQKNEDDFLELV